MISAYEALEAEIKFKRKRIEELTEQRDTLLHAAQVVLKYHRDPTTRQYDNLMMAAWDRLGAAVEYAQGDPGQTAEVTHLPHPDDEIVPPDPEQIRRIGIKAVALQATTRANSPVIRRRIRDGKNAALLPELSEDATEEELKAQLKKMGGGLIALQSTDDPALVPMHDDLMKRYTALEKRIDAVKETDGD